MASTITDSPTVCSILWSGYRQTNIKALHYWPSVRWIIDDSPHKGPIMKNAFPPRLDEYADMWSGRFSEDIVQYADEDLKRQNPTIKNGRMATGEKGLQTWHPKCREIYRDFVSHFEWRCSQERWFVIIYSQWNDAYVSVSILCVLLVWPC